MSAAAHAPAGVYGGRHGARSAREPLDVEHARRLVLQSTPLLGSERVRLADALDRVLTDDAHAAEEVPAFDNSAMDGFAVRSADTHGASPACPVTLRIVGEARAGAPSGTTVSRGEAVRISTGAMLPAGADAVVRVEDTRPAPPAQMPPAQMPPAQMPPAQMPPVQVPPAQVHLLCAVAPQRDVRHAGDDIRVGTRVLARGTVLGPAELGVLASLDRPAVPCARRPRVAVLTTGDELQEPGEPRRPGGVRNSNIHALCALVDQAGGRVTARVAVTDERPATSAAVRAVLGGGDVLIVCGGMSVGEHDHVRQAFAEAGVTEVFWRLALRPGGPAWFGVAPEGGLVFGLPGNPVSAMVTFLLLVRPALWALQGAAPGRHRARAVLDEPYRKKPGRAHAVRCRLELRDDGWHARSTGKQGSHVLTSMLGADALALIPIESAGVHAGELVEVELLGCG